MVRIIHYLVYYFPFLLKFFLCTKRCEVESEQLCLKIIRIWNFHYLYCNLFETTYIVCSLYIVSIWKLAILNILFSLNNIWNLKATFHFIFTRDTFNEYFQPWVQSVKIKNGKRRGQVVYHVETHLILFLKPP